MIECRAETPVRVTETRGSSLARSSRSRFSGFRECERAKLKGEGMMRC